MSEIHSFGVEPITSHAFNASKDSMSTHILSPNHAHQLTVSFFLKQNWPYRRIIMKCTFTINKTANGLSIQR